MNQIAAFPSARRVSLPSGGWLNVHEQAGDGPPLLLLHGFTDRAESFRLLAPHLGGRHLVMPDLRGHGDSFRSDAMGLFDLARDVEDLSSALGLVSPVVVGHSMGALVALILAAGHLKPKGLVLISASLHPAGPTLSRIANQFDILPQPLGADHPFLDEWYACAAPVPRRFLDRLRASCIAMRPQDWTQCLAALAGADLRDMARGLEVPALAVAGAMDTIFSHDHRKAVKGNLRPAMELTLQHVGHNPHWEAPRQVATAILSFLNRIREDDQGSPSAAQHGKSR